jgi:16S rRNA (cytosine967-C5)-methyltransferase
VERGKRERKIIEGSALSHRRRRRKAETAPKKAPRELRVQEVPSRDRNSREAEGQFASNPYDARKLGRSFERPTDQSQAQQRLEQSRDARAIAASILLRVEVERAFSDVLLDGVTRRNDLNSVAQALVRQFVKGVLTHRTSLDSTLEALLSGGIRSLTPEVHQILRIGAYQILHLDRAPKPLVVNECVALTKQIESEGSSRMVNAVLRRLVREGAPTHTAESDSANPIGAIVRDTSHPEWVVKLWTEQLGEQATRELCAANNKQLPTALRTNTLRLSPAELARELASEGIVTTPSKLLPDALVITTLPRGAKLSELKSFRRGNFSVQDEGSMLVSLLMGAVPGETIIDLCAAPGGKSTHLAALMKEKGSVVAVDPHPNKLKLVGEAARRLGLRSIKTICADGTRFRHDGLVDGVLVDAPCSGLGMLARKADLRWQRDDQNLPELLSIQRALLDKAATLVKPGGRIVYSTCTINADENERQVEGFLKDYPEFSLIAATGRVPDAVVSTGGFLQTLPHRHHTGGMFGAILGLTAEE